MANLAITNATQIVTGKSPGDGLCRGAAMKELLCLSDGLILIEDSTIAYIGPASAAPPWPKNSQTIDATGQVVLPGFVDSHTHLIFSGDRAQEFEQRLRGDSYETIAKTGGGINSTVACVRKASREELKSLARPRLERMLSLGITTVEVKSGYGLSTPDEFKCLEAIAELNQEGRFELVPTFLGAHAIPREFQGKRDAYIRLIVESMMPEVARQRLAEFCDVFCEEGYFSPKESERILTKACNLGLGLKIHADELTTLGGAELACRLGATSADHLLKISDRGIDALAQSGTIATLLPGTAFFLGVDYAPARKLIDSGVAVALASDCNPGTCPSENLPLVGTIACTQMKMLPPEALNAMTLNGAAAVGRADRLGTLEKGKQADLILADIPDYRHLFYHFGVNHVRSVVKRGQLVCQV